MAPRTGLGWISAVGVLAVTALLALALWRSLVLLSGYPAPALQTSDENDEYEVTLTVSMSIGLMMLGAGALTALVLRLRHRADLEHA